MVLEPMLARNFRANRVWMLDRKEIRSKQRNGPNSQFISCIYKCIMHIMSFDKFYLLLILFVQISAFREREKLTFILLYNFQYYSDMYRYSVQRLTVKDRQIERFIFRTKMCHLLHESCLSLLEPFTGNRQSLLHSVPALVIMPYACRYIMISDIPGNQSATVILGVKGCARESYPFLSPR